MSVSLGRKHETDTTPLSIIGKLRLSIRLISKSFSRLLSLLLLESEDKRRYSQFRGLSTPILFACSICCNWSYLSGDFVWSIISCLFLFHPTCPWHAVTWVLLCAEAILQASMVASYFLHLLLLPFYSSYPDLLIFFSIHSSILFGYQLYHYFLLRRHLLLPTRLSERHWIPWPISINGWTPRIFIFVRSKDNSTISFPRSTLKVPWTLLLHLLRMLIYIYFIVDLNLCLFYISYVSKIIFFLLHIYIYIFLFLFNSFVLSNVYNSYVLPFLWQKIKIKIIDHI